MADLKPWEIPDAPAEGGTPWGTARRDELMRRRAELDAELESMTLGGTAKAIGKDLDDNVRLAANGMSLGFLDKALGPEARAQTNEARNRQGITGAASEVAGSLAPMGLASGAGLTATKLPGWLGKYLGLTADGAAWGAATAAGNDKNVAEGAAWGAGAGLLGQGLQSGIGAGYKALAGRQEALPSDTLRKAAGAGYDDMRASGLVFAPKAFDRAIDDVSDIATDMGAGGTLADVTDSLFPKASSVVEKLKAKQGTVAPRLEDVELLKRALNKAGKGIDADASMNQQFAGAFKGLIDNAAPSDFIAGDVNRGLAGIQKGRDNWTKMLKTEKLEKAVESAKDRVGANYTQAGLLTAIRQEVKAIKKAKDFKQSWTPEEQKLITQVTRGRTVENAARLAGLIAPRGPVTGAVLGATAYINPALGAALTGAGMGGRALSTKIGMNRFADLQNAVQGNNATPKLSPQQQERIRAMIKAMMMGGTSAVVTQGQ